MSICEKIIFPIRKGDRAHQTRDQSSLYRMFFEECYVHPFSGHPNFCTTKHVTGFPRMDFSNGSFPEPIQPRTSQNRFFVWFFKVLHSFSGSIFFLRRIQFSIRRSGRRCLDMPPKGGGYLQQLKSAAAAAAKVSFIPSPDRDSNTLCDHTRGVRPNFTNFRRKWQVLK